MYMAWKRRGLTQKSQGVGAMGVRSGMPSLLQEHPVFIIPSSLYYTPSLCNACHLPHAHLVHLLDPQVCHGCCLRPLYLLSLPKNTFPPDPPCLSLTVLRASGLMSISKGPSQSPCSAVFLDLFYALTLKAPVPLTSPSALSPDHVPILCTDLPRR